MICMHGPEVPWKIRAKRKAEIEARLRAKGLVPGTGKWVKVLGRYRW